MRELLRDSYCYLLNKEGFIFKIDGVDTGRFDIPEEGYVVDVTSLVIGEDYVDDVISAMLFLKDNPTVEINDNVYEICIGGYYKEVNNNYVIKLYALIDDEGEACSLGKLAEKSTIYNVSEEKIIII